MPAGRGWAGVTGINQSTGGWYINTTESIRDQIWRGWVTTSTTAGTTTAILSNNTYTTASNTTTALEVWRTWVVERTPGQLAREAALRRHRELEEAPRRAALAKAEAERMAAATKFRKEAKGRARNLLSNFLTAEQKQMLANLNYFEVTVHSLDGQDRRYRIEHGSHGNVKLLNAAGEVVERLCVPVNAPDLPEEDHMLAQKFLLESNEALIRKTANITNNRGELIHRGVAMA